MYPQSAMWPAYWPYSCYGPPPSFWTPEIQDQPLDLSSTSSLPSSNRSTPDLFRPTSSPEPMFLSSPESRATSSPASSMPSFSPEIPNFHKGGNYSVENVYQLYSLIASRGVSPDNLLPSPGVSLGVSPNYLLPSHGNSPDFYLPQIKAKEKVTTKGKRTWSDSNEDFPPSKRIRVSVNKTKKVQSEGPVKSSGIWRPQEDNIITPVSKRVIRKIKSVSSKNKKC